MRAIHIKRYRLVGTRSIILSVFPICRWGLKLNVVQVEQRIRFIFFVIISVTIISLQCRLWAPAHCNVQDMLQTP
jgi:hypothetical protein